MIQPVLFRALLARTGSRSSRHLRQCRDIHTSLASLLTRRYQSSALQPCSTLEALRRRGGRLRRRSSMTCHTGCRARQLAYLQRDRLPRDLPLRRSLLLLKCCEKHRLREGSKTPRMLLFHSLTARTARPTLPLHRSSKYHQFPALLHSSRFAPCCNSL